MNPELLPFNYLELAFIAVYMLSLVAVGWWAYRARRDSTLKDFYLAGNGIGFIALLLTLYATQYSGNTLFGFSGRAYHIGYSWAMSIHFMTAIVVFYLAFAPKLHAYARRHSFITPTDYLDHRFQSPAINLLATLLMVVAISNYLLAQLMAMGRALEGLTDKVDPAQAYTWGVVSLALIIVIYETLGGFRAVVWTDVMQGSVLLVGFVILLVMVFLQFGSLESATKKLWAEELAAKDEAQSAKQARQSDLPVQKPGFFKKPGFSGADSELKQLAAESAGAKPAYKIKESRVGPPSSERSREWFSYILAVGIGGALYPQAIQRIYAARSATTLRRSLAVMAFLPLTTTLVALIVGIVGAANFPGLEGAQSDKILTVICHQIQATTLGRWLVVVLFSGILAAIMSTADSVLLSISSMLSKDIYGRFLAPHANERQITKLGKRCSWVIISIVAPLAIYFGLREDTSLVKLLDRKFDLLLQLAPAFIIGIHWRRMRAGPVFAGMAAGLVVALPIAFLTERGKLYGIHPGLYGLAVNLLISCGGSLLPEGAARECVKEPVTESETP